jgi:tetratricopeptide (TPR) repeat protein
VTGAEHKSLCDRLTAIFPERARLAEFVSWELNQNLEMIAAVGDDLLATAFKLINWAERTGALSLLQTALENLESQGGSPPRVTSSLSRQIWIAALPSLRGTTFGRDQQLRTLHDHLGAPRTHIVAIVGLGGCGKSQIVGSWLASLSPDYDHAERIFGWSFYAQGTGQHAAVSSDDFFARAFEFFGVQCSDADALSRAHALAQSIRARRTILILDGLEPFQDGSRGQVRDQALKYLLKDLATAMNGLCVITTRPPFTELDGMRGATFERIELRGLTPEAGAALLRERKVRGGAPELQAAAAAFHGHPLSLAVLGNYIREACGGVLARSQIDLFALDAQDKQPLDRLLTSYDQLFDGDRKGVLRTIALFDRPVALEDLHVVRALCDMREDRRWNRAINALEEGELLRRDEATETLDLHPLIRGHFAHKFEVEHVDEFRAAHRQLFDDLCARAPDRPTNLAGMNPLYRAVAHGCHARRWEDAFIVLRDRIRQGDAHVSLKKFGAVSADLAAFACFFTPEWEPIPDLALQHRYWLQNSAGVLHRAEGSLLEARNLLTAAVESALAMGCPDRAAESARNLASTESAMGCLTDALTTIQRAIDLADESGEPRARIVSRDFYAHLLNRRGRLSESQAMFIEVQRLQRNLDPSGVVQHYPEASYSALLVELGEPQEALRRARLALAMTHDGNSERNSLLNIGLSERSLARALMALGDNAEASRHFDASLEHLRQAARRDHIAPGLLDRAKFLLHTDHKQAGRDIEEAIAIAVPRGFRLVEADAYLTRARLEIAVGQLEEAEASLERARRLLLETGFELRVPMMLIAEALLHAARGHHSAAEQALDMANLRANAMGMLGLRSELERARAQLASLSIESGSPQ